MIYLKTFLMLVALAWMSACAPVKSALAVQQPPEKSTERQSDNASASQDQQEDGKSQDSPKEDKADEKKSTEESDSESKGDSQSDDQEEAPKSDDSKSDKSKGDKSEDKKTDRPKSADKSDDGEKKQEQSKSSKKPVRTSPYRSNPWSRDNERVANYSKKSDAFVSVFDSVVASADASTLQVMSGKRQIALGTVIDANGFVLTKASELRGKLGCKLLDGTIVGAKVVGIDPDTDLALLKVEAENLNVIQWSQDPTPLTGQWVATPKAEKDEATIGVVSVDARVIPPSRPFIGITMENVARDGGIRITQVVPRSPADQADLWVNDVIVKIDDAEIKDIPSLRDTLKNYDTHDRVALQVKRGKKDLTIKLTLAERDKVSPENLRSNQQNSMGSILSRRRKDFPSSFQHDSMLTSKTCGGPIVDLNGKVVGINIARAGRVSSLALTVAAIRPVIARLKSGELAPAVVNKQKIEAIDVELKELAEKLEKLPGSKIELERKYNVEKARIEEIEKSIADLQERMKVIDEKASDFKSELDSVRKELRLTERTRQRLEADRKQLATGSR